MKENNTESNFKLTIFERKTETKTKIQNHVFIHNSVRAIAEIHFFSYKPCKWKKTTN